MGVEQRLSELGAVLPGPPPPVGTYRPAVRGGGLLLTSGQLAMRDGAIVHRGRVGAEQTVETGREAARIAVLNALAAVRALHGSLDGLRVVRLTGYVASTPEFDRHPAVIDGASELLREAFGEDAGVGARLALGAASLPLGSPVEIDLVLEPLEASA